MGQGEHDSEQCVWHPEELGCVMGEVGSVESRCVRVCVCVCLCACLCVLVCAGWVGDCCGHSGVMRWFFKPKQT